MPDFESREFASVPARRRRSSSAKRGGSLVFCTSYANSATLWQARYRTWIDAIQEGLEPDQILIVDDGSPILPGWPDVRLSSGNTMSDALVLGRPGGVILHHFTERLGRRSNFDFPGWYRSFSFAAQYAAAHGFNRVMHIESDAYLVSEEALAFFSGFSEGWAALWSPKYNMPEAALQVASGNGIIAMRDFGLRPYDTLKGHSHEAALPLTFVNRALNGDRIGEDAAQIPLGVDYVAQLQTQREPSYYWWLRRAGGSCAPTGNAFGRVDLCLSESGNAAPHLTDGWSDQETEYRWMLAYQSSMLLPKLAYDGGYALRMTVIPFIHGDALPFQRLIIQFNSRRLVEFCVDGPTTVGCHIPESAVRHDGTDKLRLIHPDGQQPNLIGASSDKRRLALAVTKMSFVPLDG